MGIAVAYNQPPAVSIDFGSVTFEVLANLVFNRLQKYLAGPFCSVYSHGETLLDGNHALLSLTPCATVHPDSWRILLAHFPGNGLQYRQVTPPSLLLIHKFRSWLSSKGMTPQITS